MSSEKLFHFVKYQSKDLDPVFQELGPMLKLVALTQYTPNDLQCPGNTKIRYPDSSIRRAG